ncbi:uncharacterized protein Z520_06463 [Fonsecaea multimorphosa CBS 102226]|uniref:Ubiquitin-like domain-containing protein n=1 Tax=Fonsecaea multimorphosa CBS 102226 TaxID=1442371 RepID=A0A0D2H747_9EURO|nr:uncharacterized protein Z520_06463 [Fonsecaea multimorphosa CBS 102226]KIX97685.1 hypothetical protein Z520_06463 [Fonsecaea multimorphosa CBS 102226]OAL24003.1 hypothetical protein AYO22_06027 [Fonsecaea multimorphosa]
MASGGVKRPLFSKSAWIAPTAVTPDSGSIFGRNVKYEDIVRAERAEREKKAAKAKARGAGKERSEGSDTKRRRISTEEEQDIESGSASEVEHNNRNKKKETKEKARERPVTRSTPTKRKTLSDGLDSSPKTQRSPRRKADVNSTAITLDSGDEDEGEDDDLIVLTPAKPKASLQKSKVDSFLDERDSEEEEDEYLRLLKQKAREKARLQRQGSQPVRTPSIPPDRGSSATLENAADPRSPSFVQSQHDSRPASSNSIQDFGAASAGRRSTPNLEQQENDPEVKILIQSEIAGTKSLIVKRKASQSLKQVKEFWCQRFELEESVRRQVFFTWKGTRLFDSTTMRGIIRGLKKDHHHRQRQHQQRRSLSLGIDDDEGEGGDEDGGGNDDDGYDSSSTKDPSGGNVMLEAMTPEIYEQKQRDRERRQERQRSQIEDQDDENEGPSDQDEEKRGSSANAATAPAIEDRDKGAIVIRLVSKNLEPMPLRVRPHTKIGKIMRGYAAMRKVDDSKTPWLIFDGERLDAESTVEEVGFEDEDEVEVSIR